MNYTLYHNNKSIESATKNEFLIGPINLFKGGSGAQMLLHYFDTSDKYSFVLIKEKYNSAHPFESHDLITHRAAILLPYAVMSYGITDLYALNIPMFVPSVKFLWENHVVYDIGNEQKCDKNITVDTNIGDINISNYRYKPLDFYKHWNFDQYKFWVQKADFYTWKHIIYFDSLEELKDLIYNKM
eukprot:260072_1